MGERILKKCWRAAAQILICARYSRREAKSIQMQGTEYFRTGMILDKMNNGNAGNSKLTNNSAIK